MTDLELLDRQISIAKGLEKSRDMIQQAFIDYVNDAHDRQEEKYPAVLGLCGNCGFPVYKSEHGGDLRHYSWKVSRPCGYPAILRKADGDTHG